MHEQPNVEGAGVRAKRDEGSASHDDEQRAKNSPLDVQCTPDALLFVGLPGKKAIETEAEAPALACNKEDMAVLGIESACFTNANGHIQAQQHHPQAGQPALSMRAVNDEPRTGHSQDGARSSSRTLYV